MGRPPQPPLIHTEGQPLKLDAETILRFLIKQDHPMGWRDLVVAMDALTRAARRARGEETDA